MIPLDLLIALAPTALLACLWLAERMRADRSKRQRLIKLLSDADRRMNARRPSFR